MSVNDCKYSVLGGLGHTQSHINDRFLSWLQAGGATSDNIIDAQNEYLDTALVAAGTLNERWVAYLSSQTGAPSTSNLNELWYWWWCVVAAAPAPFSLDLDQDNKEDTLIHEGPGVTITEDEDSTNIDTDDDGVADIVIPKP